MFALTETWLRGTEYDEYVARDCCPTGYTLHHVAIRLGTAGGGVGAIIKNTFKVTRQQLPSFKSFEHLILLIKSATFLVRLAIVYRTGPVTSLLFDEFGEKKERNPIRMYESLVRIRYESDRIGSDSHTSSPNNRFSPYFQMSKMVQNCQRVKAH